MLKGYLTKFVAFMLIIISVLAGCGSKSEGVVAVINDEKVLTEEAKLYLARTKIQFEQKGGKDIWETPFDGRSAIEIANERALESVIRTKVLKLKAQEMGISLTEEDKKKALEIVDQVKKLFADQQFDSKLIENMLLDDYLANKKLFEQVAFEPDQSKVDAQVEETLGEYKNQNLDDILKKASIQSIIIYTKDIETDKEYDEAKKQKAKEKAEEALKSAKAGEKFSSIIEKYTEDENTKKGALVIQKGEYDMEMEKVIYALKPGDISDIIKTDKGYAIVKLDKFIEATEDDKQKFNTQLAEFEKYYKEKLIYEQKLEAFDKKYQDWKSASDIKINEDVWKKIIGTK